MPNEVENLMQRMRDHFSNLYHSKRPASVANTVLAFEPLGQPVAAGDFKLKPEDADFSANLAIERLSDIVDDIPAIADGLFIDTGRNVDDFYFMLLSGAKADPTAETWDLYSGLNNEAQKKWDLGSRASLVNPSIQYRGSFAKPTDWFRSDAAANWTHCEFSVNQPPPAAPPSTAATGIDPRAAMWKLRPQRSIALSAVLARPEVRARLMMAPAAVRPSPQLAAGAPALMAVHRAPLAFAPAAMAVHVTPVALAPAAIAVHLAAAPSVEEIHPRLNLNTRLAFNREIAISAPTASVPSPNFGMSFKYCLVEIERPWLFEPLLHEKSWRVPGYTPGAFATGNADNPAGLMPAMPVAFIAIKDLNISATWTSDDVKSIEDRIGFGPFSLVGSTFVSNTLSCPGVQIIGWICQIMPLLPPT